MKKKDKEKVDKLFDKLIKFNLEQTKIIFDRWFKEEDEQKRKNCRRENEIV